MLHFPQHQLGLHCSKPDLRQCAGPTIHSLELARMELNPSWGYQASKILGLLLSTSFPGGSGGKASARNAAHPGSIPGSGRSPGEGNGNPLQYSCPENSMDGGAWWATRFMGSQRVRHHWATLLSLYCQSTGIPSNPKELGPPINYWVVSNKMYRGFTLSTIMCKLTKLSALLHLHNSQ